MASLYCHYSPLRTIPTSNTSSCSSSPYCSSRSSSNPGFHPKFIRLSDMNNMWKSLSLKAFAMNTTQGGIASQSSTNDLEYEPEHLLILVHGIMGSPGDWTYVQAELKRQLGINYLIYASSCNTYTKTFTGIDTAGKRLAEEIMLVVKERRSVKKISFLAHSLGGLIARYAIGALYTPRVISSDVSDLNKEPLYSPNKGLIAELEPISFITLATPHLGVRGKNQLPFLFGLSILEKLAAPMAPIFIGQTGSQLFLTDEEPEKPPLLLRMASDCEDGKFISALGTFRCRIVYANICYDHMVGWRTSSIRRETELIEPSTRSLDGYKHVVHVVHCPAVSSDGPHFHPEATWAKEAVQNEPTTQNTLEYHDILEEEMIRGLQQLSWRKVDINFQSALFPFFAHNNIHVKSEWLHNAGAGVVCHVIDSIKEQETEDTFYACSSCDSTHEF
ncbi:unnamed protein product [Cuscuta epithymum]|uniref:DUF676 domain-containing protein n=2 Tax=Cuscuta epithymum TaxID=186058 RepID=A0AAV0EDA7_9ASTE|nr:unnamed protein product [Cuscuta epithymum]